MGKIYGFLISCFKIRLFNKRTTWGLLVTAAAAGILLFGLSMAGLAGNSEPGSPEDPLVTRSYVEAQLKQQADKYLQWKVVDLAQGQMLTAGAGAEIIVRAGQSMVVDTTGNGVPDVTGGTNIAAGQAVALNHHLIIPRTDGRGIIARTKAVVMYRGEVTVK